MSEIEACRVAVISIIIENREDAAEKVNLALSEFGSYVLGRMGLPYKQKNISVMSVVVDAPEKVINSLSGKLGMIQSVTAKTLFSKF